MRLSGSKTTLDIWWNSLKTSNISLNGPQIAFKLANKTQDQTVLIFGEHHKLSDKCGDVEKFFDQVFDDLASKTQLSQKKFDIFSAGCIPNFICRSIQYIAVR